MIFFKIFLNNYRRNGADKFIFLLPTDLPTEKKLPTKDSPAENFRR